MAANRKVTETQDVEIAAYVPLRSKVDALRKSDESCAFQYDTPKGNRDARSHVHTMRKVKGEIDRARKVEKADVLERGRQIDSQAKDLIAQVESMIEPHVAELTRIEEAESERVAALQERVAWFAEQAQTMGDDGEPHGSNYLRDRLAAVREIEVDESWQELQGEGEHAQRLAVEKLEALVAAAEKRETEAAELARLREEQDRREEQERAKAEQEARERAAREQKEREERAAREAEEMARKEAEAALERERQEHEAAIQREREEAERREREAREEAERKAAAEQAERDKQERARLEAEARERAEDERRRADQEHRRNINREAATGLVEAADITEEQARAVVRAIASDEVPYVQINY